MEARASLIASAISYEWEMLYSTLQSLQDLRRCRADPAGMAPALAAIQFVGTSLNDRLESALLESFLLHARSLRDFFYSDRKTFKDDVLAGDFFDDPDHWRKVRPLLGPHLSVSRGRLNKALAHLSYERIELSEADRLWDVKTIDTELEVVKDAFLAALPVERRQWFFGPAEIGGACMGLSEE
jgi:hypothetical protein